MALNYFLPKAIGWETTLACNMFCKHCGSIAGFEREKELSTEAALDLCGQLDAFPDAHVTLTGGETLVRQDWQVITEDLIKRRGALGIISNGWNIDADLARLLNEIQGIGKINIGLSLDGDEQRHDELRKPGSYERVLTAMDHLVQNNIAVSIITTINPGNLECLDHVRDITLERGAYAWQIQITSETGRAKENTSLVINRQQYRRVIETVAHYRRQMRDTRCLVFVADCLGYYGPTESDLRSRPWHGCHAGIRGFDVLSNGNVKGCLSLLDDTFIEGNVMETPLKEIWHKKGAFSYNRDFSEDKLTGPCAKCKHGHICRGGCHSTAYFQLGTVYETAYCVYADDQGLFDEHTNKPPAKSPAGVQESQIGTR
ncbi:radical SAM protein [Myxococcota bacterium]